VQTGQAEILGRETELDVTHALIDRVPLRGGLVVVGAAGIGKTTLWEAGVAAARERGMQTLSARANQAETQLSFTGLVDLLDGVDTTALGLPAPQEHALAVALLRAEPSGATPEDRAIALGLLGALRALATRNPVLVAIDDVQWLDPPSADALTFAVRRLEAVRPGPGGPSGLGGIPGAGAEAGIAQAVYP
jgi:predicted ATPase